jgi:lipopolysaccharide biosynthesis glycosyltransferase
MLTVYIGWDSREPIAADVCRHSILEHSSIPVNIVMLKQDELRASGLYWRDVDKLASTEFTFTRFLVPELNNFEETAIFMDSDMVLTTDIAELIAEVDPTKAISCVQHDYTPPPGMKMDGQQQLAYPRKNWSSMVVWNCAHPANKQVTKKLVNDPEITGAYLHRFSWLNDKSIGLLGPQWNWLVGWYVEGRDGLPSLLHYTEGGPWFPNHQNCLYADVWNIYYKDYLSSKPQPSVCITDLSLPEEIKNNLNKMLESAKDPFNIYTDGSMKQYMKDIMFEYEQQKVVGIVDAGLVPKEDEVVKEPKKDAILDNFLTGAQGVFAGSKQLEDLDINTPIVVRGIAKKKVMHKAIADGRDFYYIDTGYFGNEKTKLYHRCVKNGLQFNLPIQKNCPDDRFLATGIRLRKKTLGMNILLCPPSQKALSYWNVDLQEWLDSTVAEIKLYTDRPIIVREKQSRHLRANVNTMEMALADDVHCMVTYNSIAAVEALILGKPVFTMGPNAAQPLANTNLSRIEKPLMPVLEKVRELCCNLAYGQFTPAEMIDGTAWRILQEFQEQSDYE